VVRNILIHTSVLSISTSKPIYTGRQALSQYIHLGIFESKIAAGAEDLAKSEIAGTARLNRGEVIEEFVCFKDGTTSFRFAGGVLGEGSETSVCVSEFWCGSIG
jgi:hypothetical protein